MKKIVSLLLVLIIAFSAIACNDEPTPTTPTTPSTPKESVDDTPVDREEDSIVFSEDGKATLSIIIPETSNTGINHAATRLGIIVEEMTGITLPVGSSGETEYELHLGQTDDKAKEIYDALGNEEFSIRTVGKNIYIVAKNDLWLYDSVEYFAQKYLKAEKYTESSDNNLTVVKSINKTAKTDKSTIRYQFSVSKEVNATVKVFADATNIYYKPDSTTIPYRRQGGCFDGTHIYQALITKNDECARIMKKNIKTGETTFSEIRTDMDHANSMAYNPDKNEVMVAYGASIFIFDAETLEYKEMIRTSTAASRGIAYDPIAHQYIVRYFEFKDALDGSTVKKVDLEKDINLNDYNAYQGTSCDGYFVGALLAHSGKGTNGGYNCHIATYATDGTYMGLIKVEIPGGLEPENITFIDGEFYVTGCTTHPVTTLYKIIFDAE